MNPRLKARLLFAIGLVLSAKALAALTDALDEEELAGDAARGLAQELVEARQEVEVLRGRLREYLERSSTARATGIAGDLEEILGPYHLTDLEKEAR